MSHSNDGGQPMSAAKRDLLAKLLKKAASIAATPGESQSAIARRPAGTPAPLSPAQQRLWFMEQLLPGTAAYNITEGLVLTGPLDLATLEEAVSRMVARHEALRTTLAPAPDGSGDMVQVVGAPQRVTLPVQDLSALPPAEAEAEARRRMDADAQVPFDLLQGPLSRFTLLRLAPERHLLIVSMHHIISDGWSIGVFISQLITLYEACLKGNPDGALPELPIQFGDVALWQQEQSKGEEAARQLAWWQEHLAGPQPVLELPAVRPRPAVPSHKGRMHSFRLDPALTADLRRFCQAAGITPFMALLSVWATLLHRYTGQELIQVGTPLAGRTHREMEGLIGFFINTVVIRADLRGNPSFRELAGRVREFALGAFAHRDVPFDKLVEALAPERTTGHSPLFQTVFVLRPTNHVKAPSGLQVEAWSADTGTAKWDLTLSVGEDDHGLEGFVEYATDLFDEGAVARLVGHFNTLLAGAVAQPDRALGEVPLLTPQEAAALSAWQGESTPYPRQATIGGLFAEQARLRPEAPALLQGDRALAYGELNRRANRLAHFLQRLGVGPDVPVGICLERSFDLIAGLVAILKAGGAYVPLDAAYPQDRLQFMLADTGAPVVLTQRSLAAKLPIPAGTQVICLDELDLSGESEAEPACEAGPESLAYIIYTSGSTGRPKGVLVPHRGVVRLVRDTNYATLDAGQTFLQLAPVSFDASTLEVWGALLNGARLALPDPGTPSLDELAGAIRRYGVSIIWLTAGLFHLMVENQLDTLLTVRQVLAGGDVLSVPHVRRVLERLAPGARLINGYGPTESTTFTCCHPMGADALFTGSVPIGRPISNTQIYLLDRHMQPVPAGVPGELYIGGDGLARGYLNRPELTAERFVDSPFGRLYRTGDLVRWLPDGNVEFLGRTDNQVKIRGFRIELGEIEYHLGQHPAVGACTVVVREDEPGDKRLVAYAVPAGAVTPEELRAFMQERLPGYMLPTHFVLLESLPLTHNGKVDRKALPRPEATRKADAAQEAPVTPTEVSLAGVWAEVLHLSQVSRQENFFAAGGHSLMAIRLLARVRESFGVQLPLRALFDQPTLAGMAAEIDAAVSQGRQDGPSATLPTLEPAPQHRYEPFPQTYVQETYLTGRSGYFDLGTCGTNFYLEFEATEAGDAFVERFNQAMRRLIERHESFRTVLLPNGMQRVLPNADLPAYAAGMADLRGEAPAAVEQVLEAVRAQLKHKKGEVHAWPLFEFHAHLLDGGRVRLLGRIEALILDGTSNQIFLRELFQLLENPAEPLEPFALSMRDYVRGLEAVRDSELYRKSEAYWQQRVQELPPAPRLPLAAPLTPLTPSNPVSHVEGVLAPEAWERFKARAAAHSLTPSAAVLTALAAVFRTWSRQERLTISLVASYRFPMHPDLNRMVGNFNSISLLGVEAADGLSFAEQARRLQRQISSDLEHMYYPGMRAMQQWNRHAGAGARAASPVLANSLVEYSHSAYSARQLDRGGCTTDVGELALVDGHFTIPQVMIEPIFWVEPDGSLYSQWYAVDAAYPAGLIAAMFAAQNRLLKRLAADEAAWGEAQLGLLPAEQWGARQESPVLVLDSRLEDRPDWVPGQVYQVAAEGPVVHPRTGRRLAPTGQTGRHLPDGSVELLGPGETAWALVNGYDVELPQVECALRALPGVAEAAVTEQGGQLIAYVVPAGEGLSGAAAVGPDGAELRRALRAELPGYMVPAAFIRTRQLPLGPDGRVDRAALPVQAPDGPVAAADELEQALMDLWGEVLEEAPASLDDNFYLLGGTSLAFLRLAQRVERRFGRRLPVTVLSDGATVAHMAAALREAGAL